jgi:hypothetical protein
MWWRIYFPRRPRPDDAPEPEGGRKGRVAELTPDA